MWLLMVTTHCSLVVSVQYLAYFQPIPFMGWLLPLAHMATWGFENHVAHQADQQFMVRFCPSLKEFAWLTGASCVIPWLAGFQPYCSNEIWSMDTTAKMQAWFLRFYSVFMGGLCHTFSDFFREYTQILYSTYDIFTYISVILWVNVCKHTRHGALPEYQRLDGQTSGRANRSNLSPNRGSSKSSGNWSWWSKVSLLASAPWPKSQDLRWPVMAWIWFAWCMHVCVHLLYLYVYIYI